MSQHLSIDATPMSLGAGPLSGSLLLGALLGLAVLLVWFPPPVLGLVRFVFARLSPIFGRTASSVSIRTAPCRRARDFFQASGRALRPWRSSDALPPVAEHRDP